jgi:ubiquinone/menaquinone biosynthesis C-methylase UbiE
MNGREPGDIVESGYNQIAQDYHNQRDRFKNDDILHSFAARLPSGGRLLDVGCGAGIPVTRFLVNSGFSVTGVDISTAMLQLARLHVPEARLLRMDMRGLGFKPASFAGIAAFYSFFHVPKEEHYPVLARFHRLLQPDGLLLFCSGVTAWEGVESFHGTQMFWSHPGHEVTRQLVTRSGFELILSEVREAGGEKHYWVMARR